MADFDPDAYLAEKEGGAKSADDFDPDAYLASKQPHLDSEAEPSPEDPGVGETIVHHGLGGYFKNWSDELAGQMERFDPRLQRPGAAVKMPDGSMKFIENGDDAAAAGQALERDALKRTADAHPWWALGANVFGEFLGDKLLANVGVPVGTEAYAIASGALSGAGAADETTYGQKLGGAAIGAGAGAIGHDIGANLVGPAIGYVGRKVLPQIADAIPEAVRDFAAKRALKASGYIQKDIKPLARRDPELVLERGAELLREGTVQPFRGVEDVAKRAEAAVDKYGEAIGKVLETADQLGGKFDMDAFVKRARAEVLDPMIVNGKLDPAVKREAAALRQLIDDYEGIGQTGFESANQLKGNLQSKINWGNRFNDAKQDINNDLLMKLQGVLLDEVDNQLGKSFDAAGAPGQRIRDAFKEIKRRYGIHLDSLDKANMGMARETGNEFVSGKDAGAGAVASLLSGNPALGIGIGLANKVFRERGASTAAVAASKVAQRIEASTPVALIKQFAQTNPAALGKWAGSLMKAMAGGTEQLAATHFVLSQQDPEYRDHMKNLPALADSEAN